MEPQRSPMMRPLTGSASGPSPFDQEQPPDMSQAIKEHFHNTMADFDHRKDANRADMIGLNPSDPQYTQKLAALQAQHGALTTEKARFQMLHPWGGPGADQMPQYGGPGKPVEPGQMIPPKQLPRDEFKYQQGQLHDKAVAAEGDPDKWAEAKGEVARNKMDNPWGSPGNHPGVLGKIGHVVGNAMGAFSPQAELQAEERGSRAAETHEAEMGQKAAQTGEEKAATEHTQQETANLKNPPAKSLQDQLAARVAQDQKEGKDPAQDTLAQQISDQITSLQRQPNQQEENLDKQYNDAIAKGDHDGAKRILGEMHDMAVAKQAPQRPPQTLVVEPGGKVETARPGSTLPEGTQNVGGFSTMGRPTTQERNVGAQAQMAAAGIPGVVSEIDRLKDQLGPVSGRWNEFMQGRVGMENPEMAGLRADLLMVASAVALAHARGRLPENLRQEFDNAINAPKQDPENLKAVLNHILPWMQRMETMGQQQPGTSGAQNPPAASGNRKQTFSEFLKGAHQ